MILQFSFYLLWSRIDSVWLTIRSSIFVVSIILAQKVSLLDFIWFLWFLWRIFYLDLRLKKLYFGSTSFKNLIYSCSFKTYFLGATISASFLRLKADIIHPFLDIFTVEVPLTFLKLIFYFLNLHCVYWFMSIIVAVSY